MGVNNHDNQLRVSAPSESNLTATPRRENKSPRRLLPTLPRRKQERTLDGNHVANSRKKNQNLFFKKFGAGGSLVNKTRGVEKRYDVEFYLFIFNSFF